MALSKRLFRSPDGGSLNQRAAVQLMDTSSTVLPSQSSFSSLMIDSVSVRNHDRVLFTNLSDPTQNNKVYRLDFNSEASLPLIAEAEGGSASGAAQEGDMIFVTEGSSNGNKLMAFNGSSWQEANVNMVGVLEISNSASGSMLGTVVKKVPAYDIHGNLLGYIPLYNSIT